MENSIIKEDLKRIALSSLPWSELKAKTIVVAGGGGFLMFYAKDKERLESRFTKLGLEQVKFKFDFEGTKVIMS